MHLAKPIYCEHEQLFSGQIFVGINIIMVVHYSGGYGNLKGET